jgi:hypothetical protein
MLVGIFVGLGNLIHVGPLWVHVGGWWIGG